MQHRYYDTAVRVPMSAEQAATAERAFQRVRHALRGGATLERSADWFDAFPGTEYPGEQEATLSMLIRGAALSVREGADYAPLEMIECEADTTPTTAAFHLMNSSYFGDVAEAAEITGVLVRHFGLASGGFDWGALGGRAPDEPAGGAVFCTRDGVEYITTADWLARCQAGVEQPVLAAPFGGPDAHEHGFDVAVPMTTEQAAATVASLWALQEHSSAWPSPHGSDLALPEDVWQGLPNTCDSQALCVALYQAWTELLHSDDLPPIAWPPIASLGYEQTDGGIRLFDAGPAGGMGDAAVASAVTRTLVRHFGLPPVGLEWEVAAGAGRPGAMGAGAAFCTAEGISYFSTGAWLVERSESYDPSLREGSPAP